METEKLDASQYHYVLKKDSKCYEDVKTFVQVYWWPELGDMVNDNYLRKIFDDKDFDKYGLVNPPHHKYKWVLRTLVSILSFN